MALRHVVQDKQLKTEIDPNVLIDLLVSLVLLLKKYKCSIVRFFVGLYGSLKNL